MFPRNLLRISAVAPVVIPAVFCAVLLISKPACAGIGFQPINPEELKMTSEPLAPGAPGIILYRQVDRDDDKNTPHEDNYLYDQNSH